MENKFAPMSLKIPLVTSHEEALKKIKPITSKMRKEFQVTYATYVLAMCMGYFMPAWLVKISADVLTRPQTIAFSNIPGILRPISYKGTETIGQHTTFIAMGRCAITICLMSYCNDI